MDATDYENYKEMVRVCQRQAVRTSVILACIILGVVWLVAVYSEPPRAGEHPTTVHSD